MGERRCVHETWRMVQFSLIVVGVKYRLENWAGSRIWTSCRELGLDLLGNGISLAPPPPAALLRLSLKN